MKKRRAFSASALLTCLAALALMLSSCATLGVASKGAEYFDGKKESALAKYFGYEGDVLAEDGDGFDRMVYFSNKSIIAYMDWSQTTYTKSRRYSDLKDFQFIQMSDGCYLGINKDHYYIEYVSISDKGTSRSNLRSNVDKDGYVYVDSTHRNDNNQFNTLINSFKRDIGYYNAVSAEYDNARFDAGNVGDRYYIYSIESYSLNYQGESATRYRYKFKRVNIYLDEQTQRDTQAAYYYDISKDMYCAADRSAAISEEEALANVSGYEGRGYTLRKEAKGLSVIAYIKDGVVDKIFEPSNASSDLAVAAMGNSFAWANEILVGGANPDIQDEDGDTALTWAASNGNAEIAKLLIRSGANPNIQNENGETALIWAAINDNAEIARLLLDAGANPSIRDNDGGTALDYAEDAEIIRMLNAAR